MKFFPKIGKLLELNKDRYLMIEDLEDFMASQEEADRLKAKVVAKI